MRLKLTGALMLALAGCTTPGTPDRAATPVTVQVLAFNDFHGALEPPRVAVPATSADGREVQVPAGGAAYLASAIARLRARNPNTLVISAGDLISASPLVSAAFLDEPTILAMNLIGLDFNAVGNHEFDRGRAELLRMQNGGCEQLAVRTPCALDPDFPGARFRFLAANVVTERGDTLFPAYAVRSFGVGAAQVRIGIIGLTLRATPTHVTPAGVAGLSFGDEADAINGLIPRLRAEGADAIVVAIHQGLSTDVGYNDHSCAGVDGELLPILARLDPSVDLVVSGHTHNAYVCDYGRIDPVRPILVTSAGRSGTLVTDVTLSIDPVRGRVAERRADNVIVSSPGYHGARGEVAAGADFPPYPADPAVAALVARYAAAAAPMAARIVGRLDGPALREPNGAGEAVLGDLVADAHLAATQAPEAGGAQIAFTNRSGVRADLVPGPDGGISFGQLFTAQPFGNTLVVKIMTGRQIRAVLEQQFAGADPRPNMLQVSRGFSFAYDLTRPEGRRIVDMRLDGVQVHEETFYRVTMNSFLATGGDGFSVFAQGTDPIGGMQDIDALERYFTRAERIAVPAADRITRIDAR